jgi:tetratricopeptide (TPR) repeat protein
MEEKPLCLCCGLQRTAITDVLLPCCGLVMHGMCLATECPQCGDPLETTDALYKKSTDLMSRTKYHLQRGALIPDDIYHVYTLHLEAAKRGHVQAQLRVYEAHWMGIIVERNVDMAIYFLSLAAQSPANLLSTNAKVLLGDFYFENDLKRAQNAYYGAVQYFSTVHKNKAMAHTCAKVFNRLGKIMRHNGDTSKASAYFLKAVEFDAGNADYHHDLGVQHVVDGDFDKAEQEQRACLHLNPKHALAQYAVGFLLAKKGDKKAAVYFTRALRLGHFGAKQQLDKLKAL